MKYIIQVSFIVMREAVKYKFINHMLLITCMYSIWIDKTIELRKDGLSYAKIGKLLNTDNKIKLSKKIFLIQIV